MKNISEIHENIVGAFCAQVTTLVLMPTFFSLLLLLQLVGLFSVTF